MHARLTARIRELFGTREFFLVTFLVLASVIGAEAWKSVKSRAADASPYRTTRYVIAEGDAFGALMAKNGIGEETASAILESAKPAYDLSRIIAGRPLELAFEKETNVLAALTYSISDGKELRVKKEHNRWVAEVIEIPYEIKLKVASGTVENSMYEAGLAAGLDDRTIMNLAEAFQWTIDFAMDPRKGDTFKVLYEERWFEGEYAMPGRVLAGIYINDGTPYELYYFKEANGNEGYFDQNGNSVQKIFLRSPVEYKYISSGFTTGKRYIQAFDIATGHRAIDYAANYGAPIRAVGEGVVTFAGWSSAGYGYMTTIRHNETYSTNYAHQSKIIVRLGQRVKQGQIIGYVGSTGLSTGPHLHFEMVKHGVKINPLREVFPSGKPIAEESKAAFAETVANAKRFFNQ